MPLCNDHHQKNLETDREYPWFLSLFCKICLDVVCCVSTKLNIHEKRYKQNN